MSPESALWLLVPLAAWGGWWLARRTSGWRKRRDDRAISDRYFRGLNYLLNEQPDKAIEVFTELAEVNQETVETHLALGSLYRRRGEVDRAIRLHQNIISKPGLKSDQRTEAMLELGEDYMRAGLFDRAEKLFGELAERERLAPAALRNLLDIYQQEKDWPQALEMAERLETATGSSLGDIKCHFSCEMARGALEAGDAEAARKHLRQARRQDPTGIRPRMLLAEVARRQGQPADALKAYEEAVELDVEAIPEILDAYLETAAEAGEAERAHEMLHRWAGDYDGVSLVLAETAMLEEGEGTGAAARYLADKLAGRPSVRGLDRLIDLKLSGGPEIEGSDEILRAVAQRLLARQSTHRCTHCGFGGHTHHWQCPSCKHWGTTRAIRGVLGE